MKELIGVLFILFMWWIGVYVGLLTTVGVVILLFAGADTARAAALGWMLWVSIGIALLPWVAFLVEENRSNRKRGREEKGPQS